jgi:SAM-dependent methyltransferase
LRATGADRGPEYAARFETLAASGADVHGEAEFCRQLVPVGARVLDAGCGTGRVAIRLAQLGYECAGVDNDASMLAVAQATSAAVTWLLHDLAQLNAADLGLPFDLIVTAGNVIPLLAPGTEAGVIGNLAGCLAPTGRLVAGFGLDAAHLPLPEPPFGLGEYDAWCESAGLVLEARFAGWDRTPYAAAGYAVSVHRLR